MVCPRFSRFSGLALTMAFHFAVIVFLLGDRVAMPTVQVGQSIVAKIITEPVHIPEKLAMTSPRLQQPLVNVEPPRLDLPLGKPVSPQPMVVIEARFAPEVVLDVPAVKYPPGLTLPAASYWTEVSVQIFENGAVGDVYVERSGGDRPLDDFIVSYAKAHWRFTPSLSDGVAVPSWKSFNVEITAKRMVVHR